MFVAYRYKLLPDGDQRNLLEKSFGCCRFVYNKVIDFRKRSYEDYGITPSKLDCYNYAVRELKRDYPWLSEPDKFAIQNAVYECDVAFQKFFKQGSGYPRFRSRKHPHAAYTTNFTNGNIAADFDHDTVKLPKLGKVKTVLHRPFDGKIKHATVSRDACGDYWVSFCVETEIKQLPETGKMIGVDLGLKDLCVTSDGDRVAPPKAYYKYQKRLAIEQRKLSGMQKFSRNWKKQKKKVAKVHRRIRDIRNDFLHKLSTALIRENQAVMAEDLNVKGMLKNGNLSKAVSDASWGELLRMLKYKAGWYGRRVVKVGRFYPSSQLCSHCGHQEPSVKDLAVRSWQCPRCRTVHDRDVNAARNILSEGLRILSAA